MLVPPREAGGDPQALGGESLPFAITAKSEHPEVAAAYIDFLTDANAADVLVRTGNLPAMPAEAQPRGAAAQDVFEAWRTLTDADGLVPYLDYATPTFYDTITAGVQQLMAGRESPSEFTEASRGTSRSSPDDPTAGRAAPRRVPVPAARAGAVRRVRALPARPCRLDLAVRVGRGHARDLGGGRQLRGAGRGRRPAPRLPARRCCWCSTRRCRSRSGWCWPGAASRRACAGWPRCGRSCSCRR